MDDKKQALTWQILEHILSFATIIAQFKIKYIQYDEKSASIPEMKKCVGNPLVKKDK